VTNRFVNAELVSASIHPVNAELVSASIHLVNAELVSASIHLVNAELVSASHEYTSKFTNLVPCHNESYIDIGFTS